MANSLLGRVAAQNAYAERNSREITLHDCANNLAANWRLESSVPTYALLHSWRSDWTPEEVRKIHVSASHILDGDPKVQLGQDTHPYMIMHHNPSPHLLNVEPMGLYDEDKKIIKSVPSGALVRIPIAYTRGGKASTVRTIAPQLEELPSHNKDHMLDIRPQTYSEWITYKDYTVSTCCGRSVVWYDNTQKLLCTYCKKDVLC